MNKTSPESVVVIAPVGDPSRRVRLRKVMARIQSVHRKKVVYWGWRRTSDEPVGNNMESVCESKVLLSGGGFRNRKTRLLYIVWSLRVFLSLLASPPDKVYCLGFETALPTWAASIFRRQIKYIFDDADRFVLLWNIPEIVRKIITWFEIRVSNSAFSHLIPTTLRYDYSSCRHVEIFNMPSTDDIQRARLGSLDPPQDRLAVYVNGWLDESRGSALIDIAAEMLEGLDPDGYEFNVAIGRSTAKLDKFLTRSNVVNLGTLSHIQSLAQYRSNHVVLTFYDPQIAINRFAAPNKWGDAIAMGTPIILNEEIVTASKLLTNGAALSVPFDDPSRLADALIMLRRDKSKLENLKEGIRQVQSEFGDFDSIIDPVIDQFVH